MHNAGPPNSRARRGALLRIASSAMLASGAAQFAAAQERTAGPLIIGQSADFSGPLGEFGKQLAAGLGAALAGVNRRGGIQGRQLQLVAMDDGFSVAATQRNARELVVEHRALALMCSTGTPASLAQAQFATEHGVPLIGPASGSEALARFPDWVFTTRARLHTELAAIVHHLQRIGVSRIGIVYGENSGGRESLEHVLAVAAQSQLTIAVRAGVLDDRSNSASVAQSVRAAQPQAVILAVTAGAAVAYLEARGGAEAHYGISFVDPSAIFAALGPLARGLVVAQVAPSPKKVLPQVVSAYRDDMRAAGSASLSHASLEGYIAGRVLTQTLRVRSDAANPLGLAKSLRNASLDLGGLDVRFGNPKVGGSTYVELTMLRADGALVS